jgi:hypothetical protein
MTLAKTAKLAKENSENLFLPNSDPLFFLGGLGGLGESIFFCP